MNKPELKNFDLSGSMIEWLQQVRDHAGQTLDERRIPVDPGEVESAVANFIDYVGEKGGDTPRSLVGELDETNQDIRAMLELIDAARTTFEVSRLSDDLDQIVELKIRLQALVAEWATNAISAATRTVATVSSEMSAPVAGRPPRLIED